jgi:exodeoxyribonuclease III
VPLVGLAGGGKLCFIMRLTMRIATWNVNSIRIRLPHVLRWLHTHAPDVLLLQETKVENALFPAAELASLGYHLAAYGQPSYNGVAIVSKLPLTDVQPGLPPHLLEGEHAPALAAQARVLSATVATAAGPLRLINAYVVNGENTASPKFTLKEAFYAALTAHATASAAAYPNLLVAGDFNVCADERDVDNVAKREGKVLFTETERAWLQTFAQSAGLHDALRLLSDAPGIFSWWDYREFALSQNRGLRIDYVWLSAALKPKLTHIDHHTAERTEPQPSDHIPVLVELKL